MNNSENDSLFRFLFEECGVRGNLVYLDASWRAVLERHHYPSSVIPHLGELAAGSLLLSAILKLNGSLIVQAQGEGPVTTMVAQAGHDRYFRALARWHEAPEEPTPLSQLIGKGHLALTIDPVEGERYQGVVSLEGDRLEQSIESYFAQSEQLPTLLKLAADGNRAAGLMIQVLPSVKGGEEDWNRIRMLTDTLSREELLTLPMNELLHRLYHEETVRLFEPEPVAFRCHCSREKMASGLRSLGRAELEAILAEEEAVTTTCEFCNKSYKFDAVDVDMLFSGNNVPAPDKIQ